MYANYWKKIRLLLFLAFCNVFLIYWFFLILFCFNISKYHLNWKLLHKTKLSFKRSLQDTTWFLQDLWLGMRFSKKSQGFLPNVVREILEKSGNFIIQNHWSPLVYIFWEAYLFRPLIWLRKDNILTDQWLLISWYCYFSYFRHDRHISSSRVICEKGAFQRCIWNLRKSLRKPDTIHHHFHNDFLSIKIPGVITLAHFSRYSSI